MTDKDIARQLFEKHQLGLLSPEEQILFEKWYAQWESPADMPDEKTLLEAREKMRSALMARNIPVLPSTTASENTPSRNILMRRIYALQKWQVAAVLVLIAGAAFFLFQRNNNVDATVPQDRKPVAALPNDVSPGKSGALLYLEDGSTLELAGTNDTALKVGNHALTLNNDVLTNKGNSIDSEKPYFLTLETRRGNFFRTILSDGTAVWLNAASRLRYPAAFATGDRIVELDGEAYFEVAHDATRPFLVKANGSTVKVLGTHFNVKAYQSDRSTVTTLLEGAVEVRLATHHLRLQPGAQAIANLSDNTLQHTMAVNTEAVVAWKNGLFNFEGADITAVMQQLEHWYDITVIYPQGKPQIRFFGEMDRGLTLGNVLRILEKSNLHFELKEERKLYIYP